MSISALVIYGWDLSDSANNPMKLANDDGSKEFKKEFKALIENLDGDFFEGKSPINKKQRAFGVLLGEFDTLSNTPVSFVSHKPRKSEIAELKNSLSGLDKESRGFFRRAGKPRVFILWYKD